MNNEKDGENIGRGWVLLLATVRPGGGDTPILSRISYARLAGDCRRLEYHAVAMLSALSGLE
jgi:hypothetical protein